MDQAHAKGILPFSQIFSDIFSTMLPSVSAAELRKQRLIPAVQRLAQELKIPGFFCPFLG